MDRIAAQVADVARTVPGVTSALAERLTGGRYVDIDIDRRAAARYGLNIADVQSIVSGAVGGETIGQTVEGLARYRSTPKEAERMNSIPTGRRGSCVWRFARRASPWPIRRPTSSRP